MRKENMVMFMTLLMSAALLGCSDKQKTTKSSQHSETAASDSTVLALNLSEVSEIQSDSSTADLEQSVEQSDQNTAAATEDTEIRTVVYYAPSAMKIRQDPSLEAEQVGSLAAGSYVEFEEVQTGNDSIWGRRPQGDWICIKKDGDEYLDLFDLEIQSNVLENAAYEDFVIEFDDGWLIIQNGQFGFLRPDGTYKYAPVKASVSLIPEYGLQSYSGCLYTGDIRQFGMETGSVTVCNPLGGGAPGRWYVDDTGRIMSQIGAAAAEPAAIPEKDEGTAGVGLLNENETLLYITDSESQTVSEPMPVDEPRSFRFIDPFESSYVSPYLTLGSSEERAYNVSLNGLAGKYPIEYPYYEGSAANALLHGKGGETKSGYDFVQILSPKSVLVRSGQTLSVLDQNLQVMVSANCDFLSAPVNGKCLMRIGETWQIVDA